MYSIFNRTSLERGCLEAPGALSGRWSSDRPWPLLKPLVVRFFF